MIYWVTGTIGSSIRMYRDAAADPAGPAPAARRGPERVRVLRGRHRPAAAGLGRAHANVVRWSELPRGGHFAPLEEPELYVEELRAFFRPYRDA